MAVIYKKEIVEHDVLDKFICDRCKTHVADELELDESYSLRFTGGFTSVFGDMNNVGCDLCQECLYELISDFCVYNADN